MKFSRALFAPALLLLTLRLASSVQAAPTEVSPLRAAQIEQLQAWGEAGRIETPSPLNLDVRAADTA